MNRFGLLFLFWASWLTVSAQFSDDFSTKSLSDWMQSAEGHWDIGYTGSDAFDATNPQLHHSFDNTSSGKDAVSHSVLPVEYFNGNLTWKFRLKHGNDPSSTNGWTFLLCSSVNAQEYIEGIASESIHIGINLKGSDDILRIWRQSIDADGNSSLSELCETTVNWQNYITKNSCGYVVVTRNSDGEWIIKLSKSSFASANEVGAFTNMASLPWGNIGIYHWYTSSGDQKIWADDISVDFEQTKFTDLDSETQVIALPDVLVAETGASVDLFRMNVVDKGSQDNKPTSIQAMKFKVLNNGACPTEFEMSINGIAMPASGVFSGQFLKLIPDVPIDIQDGTSAEISVSTVVPSSAKDGDVFSIEMESSDGIVLSDNSSKIGTFIPERKCTARLDVVASKLQSIAYPKYAVRNSKFNVEISAVNEGEKVDLDYAEPCVLELFADNGSMFRETVQFNKGNILFDDIAPVGDDFFDISIRSGSLAVFSDRIILVNDTTSFVASAANRNIDISCRNADAGNSVTFAEFTVSDIGNDGLPTLLKTANFSISPTSILSEKLLSGVKAYSDLRELPVRLSKADANKFSLEFLDGGISVADKSIAPLRFDLIVNPSSLTDNSTLTIHLEKIETDKSGSSLRSHLPLEANTLNVKIDADTLCFTKFSSLVKPFAFFNIDVKATDLEGNVDTDIEDICYLVLTGADTLYYEQNFVKGIAKFLPIQLPKSGEYLAYSYSGTFKTQKTLLVADSDSYLLQPSENIVIDKIESSDKWFDAIRFFVVDAGTSDTLSTKIREISFSSYDLSGNEISSRTIEAATLSLNGQMITPASISYSSGKLTFKFDENALDAPNDDRIECLLRMKLRTENYSQPFFVGCNIDGIRVYESSSLISSLFSQIIISDTIVYENKFEPQPLLLDGWYSTSGNATVLLNGQVVDAGSLSVSIDGVVLEDWTLSKDKDTLSFKLQNLSSNGTRIIANYTNSLPDTLILQLKGGLEYGDVVVSEIMADPSPSIDLPEVEYVELYNRTSVDISLKGWKVKAGGKIWTLLDGMLPAGGYIAVSSPSGASLLSGFGISIGTSYFGGLPNGGADIVVSNVNGKIITSTYYTDFLQSAAKIDGGRSIERIDVNSDIEEPENWALSEDARGGTPGQQNSVARVLTDDVPPALVLAKVAAADSLVLEFSESIRIGELELSFGENACSMHHFFNTHVPNMLCIKMDETVEGPAKLECQISGVTDAFGNAFSDNFYVYFPAVPDATLTSMLQDTVKAGIENNRDANAVAIAELLLEDKGNDRHPAILLGVSFSTGLSESALQKLLGGVTAAVGAEEVPCRIKSLSDGVLGVEFLDGVRVDSGSAEKLQVSVYLKEKSLSDIEMPIALVAADMDTLFSILNSAFPQTANLLCVDVVADTLSFSKFPQRVQPGIPFLLSCRGVDKYGNVDSGIGGNCYFQFIGSDTLSFASTISGSTAKSDSIMLPKGGCHEVKAEWGGLSTARNLLIADADSYLRAVEGQRSRMSVAPDSLFDALSFYLVDLGTGDGLPTEISQLQLQVQGTDDTIFQNFPLKIISVLLDSKPIDVEYNTVSGGKAILYFTELNTCNGSSSRVTIKTKSNGEFSPLLLKCIPESVRSEECMSQINATYCQRIVSDTIVCEKLKQNDYRILLDGWYSTSGNATVLLNNKVIDAESLSVSVNGAILEDWTLSKDKDTLSFKLQNLSSYGTQIIANCTNSLSDTLILQLKGGIEYGDVVVSEIMADPSPSVDLPEVEYLELYNRTSSEINLKGWKVEAGGKIWTLLDGALPAGGFIAVSSPSGASLLSGFGISIGTSYFGGLPNGGADIVVSNVNGKIITSTYYTDVLQSAAKIDGGRSIERIDVNSDIEEPENWALSEDARGGTPGQQNSVARVLTDDVPPALVLAKVAAADSLVLEFSESIRIGELELSFGENACSMHHFFNTHVPNMLCIKMDETVESPAKLECQISGVTDAFGNAFSDNFYVYFPAVPDATLTSMLQDTVKAGIENNRDANAVAIAELLLEDKGNDRHPAILRNVSFSTGLSESALQKLLGGVTAAVGADEVPCRIKSLSDGVLGVEFLDGVRVDSGSAEKLQVSVYHKEKSLSDIEMPIALVAADMDTLCSIIDSEFPQTSRMLCVDVIADTLSFSKFPQRVQPGVPFSLACRGVDKLGNVDSGIEGNCIFQFVGADTLSFASMISGSTAKSDSIMLPKGGCYEVKAEWGGLSTARNLLVADADSYLRTVEEPRSRMSVAPDSLFDALSFYIVDLGTGDGLPTGISQLQLQAEGTDGTALPKFPTDSITVLLDGMPIQVSSKFVTGGKATLNFNGLEAADGSSSRVTIRAKRNGEDVIPSFIVKCIPESVKSAECMSQIIAAYSQRIISDTIVYNEHSQKVNRMILDGWFSTLGNATVLLNSKVVDAGSLSVSVDGVVLENWTLSQTRDTLSFNMQNWSSQGSLIAVYCAPSITDTLTLQLKGGLEYGDVVVSEIMADPSPSIDLPEVEYLELYNRTSADISLKDWKVEAGGKTWTLNDGTLLAGRYIAISSPSGASLLSGFGISIGTSYFGGLPNSGSDIVVSNVYGKIITSTFYTDALQSAAKIDGGCSIERIDVNSDIEEPENWALSEDTRGGTPGQANSIAAAIDSGDPLVLQKIEVFSDKLIIITFNNSLIISDSVKLFVNGENIGALFSQTAAERNKLIVELPTVTLTASLATGRFENLNDVFGNVFMDEFNFAYCPVPKKGDIIINEVLFNPDEGCSPYVEFKNISDKAFDMAALAIARRDANGEIIEKRRLKDGFSLFLPDKLALVCSTPNEIAARYPMCNLSCFSVLQKMPQYGTKEGNVVLLDTAQSVIDEFAYSEKMHHKMLPTTNGVSLERVNSSASAWHSASKEVMFGTPGEKNSQNSDVAVKRNFSLASDIISPDGDGYNDYLSINYLLDEPGAVATMDVFNSAGKLVKHLRRNEMLGVEGAVEWDGVMDNGVHVSRGIYLVLVRITYASGNTSTHKMPFSVAYR